MEHSPSETKKFGFWVYLMTDCILFAGLFAAYAVLQGGTFGGQTGKELFSLPFVLLETVILLTSSFTSGLMMLEAQAERKNAVIGWLSATFILGVAFLSMELTEFSILIHNGHGPQTNGFLSSYFTLLGTHGIHIIVGLIWIVALVVYLLKRGLTPAMKQRLMLFSMFWHFLDIIWIFIFTIVYLYGHI